MEKQVILNSKHLELTLNRLCYELIESHNDFSETVLVGLQPRGVHVVSRLKKQLETILQKEVLCGNLDITFFRDDFRRREKPLIPSITNLDFSIENKKVVLVDDVLYTGRTIRSGLDALLTFGRPSKIELLVLIDRRFRRDLPIQANYIGKAVDTLVSERVSVEWKESEGEDKVVLLPKKTMNNISVDHLTGIKNLTPEDLQLIFKTADSFKEVINRPIKKVPTLRDITIANIFFENSTRTRLSFELAEKRLSADVVNFSASGSSVKKGETLIDTVNNILSMKVDMVVMRHSSPGASEFLSKKVNARVINAGDGTHEHPTQALLDAYSIREKLGSVEGKKVVIVGDILHSRVALSNIYCLQKLGAEVMVCGPTTLIPKYIGDLGVKISHNLIEALEWCDVANMLRIQLERQDIKYFPSLREYSQQFGLNKEILNSLSKEIVVMHPGPINRGVEITSDVADSKQSIILQQVENGVAIRMAVIYLLASKIER